jgi:pyruvate/2-oxoglutarate dehydrogenase complex dihydrolipoamide dehydrogenase (E3) component
VFRRKKEMVDGLIQLHLDKFKASGAELVMGTARFTGPKTVDVTLNAGGTRTIRGERVFLGVGSRASLPDVPGLAEAAPMTPVEALNLQRLPERMVILGGGYIGLEFAQAMQRFGSQVTLIHHGARLLEREDADVSAALLELLEDEGVKVLLNTEVLKVTGHSGERAQLSVQSKGVASVIEASDILAATGRTPNTQSLDLAKAGVELASSGHIRVNEKLETTAPDVWAMGDCAGSPHFTHVSFDDFRIVLDNLSGGLRTTRDRLIPYCLFTDPELAHVGMNESEAKAKNISYRLVKLPVVMILRTRTLSATRGFVKALIGDDNRLLGFTAFGVEASELLAAAQTAMLGGMPYMTLRDAIFTHPTVAEGFGGLFSNVPSLSARF